MVVLVLPTKHHFHDFFAKGDKQGQKLKSVTNEEKMYD